MSRGEVVPKRGITASEEEIAGRVRPCDIPRTPSSAILYVPVPVPATHFQPIPRYMTQAEVRAFFRGISSLRDKALFSLMYLYGLRVSEVSLLEREDVDLVRGRIIVKRVKNGVWTERPLFSRVRELLDEYLGTNPSDRSKSLFRGRCGPLKKRQIQTLFSRYRDRAGLSRRYTCHSLRHSIATHLLDAGASLEFVQDHLGHRNIRSTTIYARITDRYRAAQFRRLESSPWIVHPGELEPSPLPLGGSE